jgi:L-ascorbate metabolism protein UlaG (beta-lactamase superfamily)
MKAKWGWMVAGVLLFGVIGVLIASSEKRGDKSREVPQIDLEEIKRFDFHPAELREAETSTLTGLGRVSVFVEALPADLEESGLKEGDFFALIFALIEELEGQIKKYGIAVLPRQTTSADAVSPILAIIIYAKTDINKEMYTVGCSLSLKKIVSVSGKKEKSEEAIAWQKNRFASCQAGQVSDTVKKCLADCLDAFGREFSAANPKKDQSATQTADKNAGGQNMLTGQIKHITIEGGFYGIIGDDGQKYDPVNLANEFKKDGLRVRFAVKEKEGVAGFHMWGKIVEIVSIEVAGKEADTAVTLQWLGHASFRICHKDDVVYIDPWKLKEGANDATVVLVSHSHSDHYSPDDLQKIWTANTKLISSADVVAKEGKGEILKPGQTIEVAGIKITGVAAYNPAKQFHPRSNNWLGFVIEINSIRIYFAGDTDIVDEMKSLKNIDVALLPVGGKYTMDANEAAQAVKFIKPKQAIPCHFGEVVGGESDAMRFAEAADCDVLLVKPGEIVMLKE